MTGTGFVEPNSALAGLSDTATGEYLEYYQATQAWSDVLPVSVGVAPVSNLIPADTTQDTQGSGPVSWVSRGFINVDAVGWAGDGDSERPENLNEFSRIVHATDRLTDDYVEVIVMQDNPDDNDTFGAALFTDLTAQSGYHLEITSNNTNDPDRLELRRQDNGVFTNLNFFPIPMLVDGDTVTLGVFKSTGIVVIKVNGVEVGSFNDATYQPERWGMVAELRNQGTAGVKAFGANGLSPLQIETINGSFGIATVENGANTIRFTEDYAPATVQVTDSRGLVSTFNATPVNAREITFNAVMDPHWKGVITLELPNLLQRNANYPAPAGFQYRNLGMVVGPTATTFGHPANAQETLPLLTAQGFQVTPVGTSGEYQISGGELAQSLSIAINTGSGYGAAVNQFIFETIAETSQPPASYPAGESVAINLEDHFTSAIDIPDTVVGSSGNPYSIATTLPAGLTRTGKLITGSMGFGQYQLTVDITDAAGVAVQSIWPISAVSANQPVALVGTIEDQVGEARITGGYQFSGAFVDPDGDPIEYTLTPHPDFITINQAEALITWDPQDADAGTYDLILGAAGTVGDPTQASAPLRITIAAYSNQAPVASQGIPPQGFQAGVLINWPVPDVFTDPDGDLLTRTLDQNGQPLPGTLSYSGGFLNGVAPIGVYNFRAGATDPSGLSGYTPFDATFSIGSPLKTADIPNQSWTIGVPITPINLLDHFQGLPSGYSFESEFPIDGVNFVNDQLIGTPSVGLDAQSLSVVIRATNAAGHALSNTISIDLAAGYVYQRTARHTKASAV